MLTVETMWKPHIISEKNRTVFQDLCQIFEQSPGVFQCKHQLANDVFTVARKYDINKESPAHHTQTVERSPSKRLNLNKAEDTPSKRTKLKKAEISSENSEATGNKTADIKALQTMLIASVNSSEILDRNFYKDINFADMCRCDAIQVDDEILMQVCKKSEKFNSTSVSVLGKFLFLPKVLSTSLIMVTFNCKVTNLKFPCLYPQLNRIQSNFEKKYGLHTVVIYVYLNIKLC